MSLKKALVYLLKRDVQVGNLCNGRIYPGKVPQRASLTSGTDPGAFPHITYFRISRRGVPSQDGQVGLAQATVRFTVWALTHESADALAEAIRQARDPVTSMRLDGWKQAQMGPCFVQSCWISDMGDGYDSDQFSAETGLHSIVVDAECWYDDVARAS